MNSTKFSVLCGAAFLAACNGNNQFVGIDGGGAFPPPPPVAVNVISFGTITGFGSIIVNDVRYDIGGAAITVDGNPGSESDLSVGQVVTIRGTLDSGAATGTALSVDFNDLIEGPITSIDMTTGTIVVLEQPVRIDDNTSLDASIAPASIAGLSINDVVEISGFFLAEGGISATRIEPKPAGGEFEVNGTIDAVTPTNFAINGLVVDYSAAMIENFPNGAPEDGQPVEAKGGMLGQGGELIATRIEFKGLDLSVDDVDQVEIEGFVTRFASATDFDIEGIPVTTNGQTVFENGASADLSVNRKVEVEGSIEASGTLVADKVEIKPSGAVRVESLVEDVQPNQFTVLSLVVDVNASTRLEDKSAADIESFSLSDINVGDYVEVRGFEDSSGIVATRLEREDFDGEVSLRGFVDTLADPDFSILGVTIQTGGGTVFRDTNDQPITAVEFFDQASGRLVESNGTLSNGFIVATEVELEN